MASPSPGKAAALLLALAACTGGKGGAGPETASDGSSDTAPDGGADSGADSGSGSGGAPDWSCADVDLGEATGAALATGGNAGMGDDRRPACTLESGEDVFLRWRAPADGAYRVSTLGSTYDTVLVLLEGDCGGRPVDCNDDWEGGFESLLEVEAAAGDTFVFVVDAYEPAEQGTFFLNIAR